MPEVSSRNTRHERLEQIQTFVVAVYSCPLQAGLRTCLRTYLRQEPLSYFSYASPGEERLLFQEP